MSGATRQNADSTLDAPYTARGRDILNSFGVRVAVCVDASTAVDMAEGLTLLRMLCERGSPAAPDSTGQRMVQMRAVLLTKARELLGLRVQGWEGTR